MRKLTLGNYLFLIPALLIGPVILVVLIAHGILLIQWYRFRRWYDREIHTARVIPMNVYLARQLRRR